MGMYCGNRNKLGNVHQRRRLLQRRNMHRRRRLLQRRFSHLLKPFVLKTTSMMTALEAMVRTVTARTSRFEGDNLGENDDNDDDEDDEGDGSMEKA